MDWQGGEARGTAGNGRHGKAWQGKARPGKARQARHDVARRDRDGIGTAGMAWLRRQQQGQVTAPLFIFFF